MNRTLRPYELTKADERVLIDRIIEDCPAGYVRSILEDSRLEIYSAITSDFGFINLRARMQHHADLQKQTDEARAELQKIQAEIRDKTAQVHHLENRLHDIRKDARLFVEELNYKVRS